MKVLSILLVVTSFPLKSGDGRAQYNELFVSEMLKKHCKITVLHLRTLNPTKKLFFEEQIGNIKYQTLRCLIPFNNVTGQKVWVGTVDSIVKWYCSIGDLKPSTIHGIGGNTCRAAFVISETIQRPFIIQIIGTDVNSVSKWFLSSGTRKMMLERARRIVFNSFDLYKKFTIKSNAFLCKITVVKRGVITKLQSFELGCSVSVNILYLGGAPSIEKGFKVFINALKFLSETRNFCSLNVFIAGPGIKNLKFHQYELGSKIKIEFKGAIPHQSALKEIQRTDIVVIPSLSEGVPNVLYEALGMGKMIIASNIGGINEVLTGDYRNFLFNPNNHLELAKKIAIAAADSDIRSKYSKLSLEIAKNYPYAQFIDCYYKIYQDNF
jgi:glycosyltransferase involved in cell wall biosynthesis